ncbi:hypothetical protein [Luteimonas sp. MC1750]|uniref:hypothetical protein n=1 Tax=Luteimonas sp. MC1750 TaxID=2799326 RepID=UPI0018F0FD4E|nr:hypothetical protein [Luteimonas sp. MC1750]MBJ6983986.1 hypothetical protein [Luteimonas sp. MC1750]QQO06798.1 hypothetical protein JGR68_05070 [Luteimonas sp. MC1750]
MSEHVPDGKTQVKLAEVRWRHRTNDILRRSGNLASDDLALQLLEEQEQSTIRALYKTAGKRIGVAYLKANELLLKKQAVMATISEACATWEARGQAGWVEASTQRIKEKVSQLGVDYAYIGKLRAWASDLTHASNHTTQDTSMYVQPVDESMTQAQKDRVMREAYISSNNGESLLVRLALEYEAAKQVLGTFNELFAPEHQAGFDEWKTLALTRHEQALSEDEQRLEKNADYIIDFINYRQP